MLNLCELLRTPESQNNYNVTGNGKRDSSKMFWIGQSAAKLLLNGEGSTTRELCPVGYKLLVSEAHSIQKDEDIVCSAWKHAGVAYCGIKWYYSSNNKGEYHANHSRVNRKVQREMGAKQEQSMLGMAGSNSCKRVWTNKNTGYKDANCRTQIVVSHSQGRDS